MATVLRPLSYKYQWLYDTISRLAATSVGGERRFHHLPLQGLTIDSETQVLDLCCGGGQATRFLVEYSQNVTGLDVSPLSLQRAEENVPQAKYVEAFAEDMPFSENQFDLVHTSVALHEMPPSVLQQILREVYRVSNPVVCSRWWIFTSRRMSYLCRESPCFSGYLKRKRRGNYWRRIW